MTNYGIALCIVACLVVSEVAGVWVMRRPSAFRIGVLTAWLVIMIGTLLNIIGGLLR